MIFAHNTMVHKPGSFCFRGPVTAVCPAALNNPTVREVWHGFTFHLSELCCEETGEMSLTIGQAERLATQGAAYAIHVTEEGVSIAADDEKNLVRGLMTLLDLVKLNPAGDGLEIPCGELRENPAIQTRMIHYCVFHSCEL